MVDDRITGAAGRMMLARVEDLGAKDSDFRVRTPPPGRPDDNPFSQGMNEAYNVAIRSWQARIDKRSTDVTSSMDYSAQTDMVWARSIPTSARMSVAIEGVLHLNETTESLILAAMDGAAMADVILAFSETSVFAEGSFDVSGMIVNSIIDGVVSFNAQLTSQGVPNVTLNQRTTSF